MSKFGKKSASIRETLHPVWQVVLDEAIKSDYFNFSLMEGYRGNEDQDKMFYSEKSKARAGESPHNYSPSFAVDLVPYPSGYTDGQAMLQLAGHIIGTAERLGVTVTCGSDWDRDGMVIDTNFKDFWHFELTEWRKMI
jgi:peptidoglycan L-alanyl-D-glutamate endopeptidase CwlK